MGDVSEDIKPVDIEAFRDLAAQQARLAREATKLYAAEVDAILDSHCTDAGGIEHLLDGLLDFCFDDDMLLLFKKLCRYYFRIDPAATADYVHTYRQMSDKGKGEKMGSKSPSPPAPLP